MITLDTNGIMACPFCGASSIHVLCLTAGVHLAQCAACGAQGPFGKTEAEGVRAWGSRGALPWAVCRVCRRRFTPVRRGHVYDRHTCRRRAAGQRRRRSPSPLVAQVHTVAQHVARHAHVWAIILRRMRIATRPLTLPRLMTGRQEAL